MGMFGTDGIRGRAGTPPLDTATALRLGRAIGEVVGQGGGRRVVVGRDTRISGAALEAALSAGLAAAGCQVVALGVAPTPAVAWETRYREAEAGVMISASHNPFQDNGIKVFGPDGFKLADAGEARIEALLQEALPDPEDRGWGGVSPALGAAAWRASLLSALDGEILGGLRIVVDAAGGAAWQMATEVLEAAGARVTSLDEPPDGISINAGRGALHPERVAAAVREAGADLGVALDGDADRCILVDERGAVVDGDPILGLWARALAAQGELPGRAVVATVMSNLGLERWLDEAGIALLRTDVGDKHVARALRSQGLRLGGEQSGHVIDLARSTTGDGLLTALSVARIMASAGRSLSALCAGFHRAPQVLINVPVARRVPLEDLPAVRERIAAAEAALGREGRVLVRYSGTELKARVMIEGPDAARIDALAREIGEAFTRAPS